MVHLGAPEFLGILMGQRQQRGHFSMTIVDWKSQYEFFVPNPQGFLFE